MRINSLDTTIQTLLTPISLNKTNQLTSTTNQGVNLCLDSTN